MWFLLQGKPWSVVGTGISMTAAFDGDCSQSWCHHTLLPVIGNKIFRHGEETEDPRKIPKSPTTNTLTHSTVFWQSNYGLNIYDNINKMPKNHFFLMHYRRPSLQSVMCPTPNGPPPHNDYRRFTGTGLIGLGSREISDDNFLDPTLKQPNQ